MELLYRIQLFSWILFLTVGAPARAERFSHQQDQPEFIPVLDAQLESGSVFDSAESVDGSLLDAAGDSADAGARVLQWGIALGSRKHGYHKNSEALMMPASTQKVVTAIAALKYLPGNGDFRFQNSFQGDFDAETGILRSPEFLVSGDPTWGHEDYVETLKSRLQSLVAELKKRGVKLIVGPITVTNTVPAVAEWTRPQEDDREGPWRKRWRWESDANVVTPATLQENMAVFQITGYRSAKWLTPGASGRLEVNLSPRGGEFEIEPIFDDHGRAIGYRMSGGMPADRVRRVHLQDGDNWLKSLAAQVFNEDRALRYTLLGPPPRFKLTTPSFGFEAISAWRAPNFSIDLSSKPLREVLIPFVQKSINLIGNALYLQIAHHQKTNDVDGLLKTMISQITRNTANLEPEETPGKAPARIALLDGSGLRLDNRLRASVLRDLLEGVRDEDCFNDFFASLAVAGQSGTLAGRLGGYAVFGKTGTVDYVKNLVGYYRRRDGTLEPFAFLTHTSTQKSEGVSAAIDALLLKFARQNGGLAAAPKPRTGAAKKAPSRKPSTRRSH